jgi:hypothetical protein
MVAPPIQVVKVHIAIDIMVSVIRWWTPIVSSVTVSVIPHNNNGFLPLHKKTTTKDPFYWAKMNNSLQ